MIANVDPSVSDEDAKKDLCELIDNFIQEKITAADALIAESASKKIGNGDVILVHAKSSIVLKAKKGGKSFKVVVVDSKPLLEGRNMVKDLASAGVEDIEYTFISGVSHCKATKALLGAHALMANGRLFGRAGTALVAMTAHTQGIPVMVCCESLKFTDSTALDSILKNEAAPTSEGLPGANLEKLLPKVESTTGLFMLNLLYDVSHFIPFTHSKANQFVDHTRRVCDGYLLGIRCSAAKQCACCFENAGRIFKAGSMNQMELSV